MAALGAPVSDPTSSPCQIATGPCHTKRIRWLSLENGEEACIKSTATAVESEFTTCEVNNIPRSN